MPASPEVVVQECGAGVRAGLVAAYRPEEGRDGVAAEVRAFFSDAGTSPRTPVTGSLNAGLAQWLVPAGHLPHHGVAAQGTVLGRVGRVHVDALGDTVWVGGATHTIVAGQRVM